MVSAGTCVQWLVQMKTRGPCKAEEYLPVKDVWPVTSKQFSTWRPSESQRNFYQNRPRTRTCNEIRCPGGLRWSTNSAQGGLVWLSAQIWRRRTAHVICGHLEHLWTPWFHLKDGAEVDNTGMQLRSTWLVAVRQLAWRANDRMINPYQSDFPGWLFCREEFLR